MFVPDGELAPGVGVISLRAGEVRSIELRVEHAPLDDNRAHMDVGGEKTTEARLKLLRVARWAIPVQRITPSTTGTDQ